MFYLSPCNSFYILGLCSLASSQSQPRDTGLYQAHMCALLQLTHISSFVTVTKLARLSWEMCRLWLTAHVWILYFESHANLSNTGSVKASLTPLSSTGAGQSCTGSAALTSTSLNYLTPCTCVWEEDTEHHTPQNGNLRRMFLACPSSSSAEKIFGEKSERNIFHACILGRLPARRKSPKGEQLYALIRSLTKITRRKAFPKTAWCSGSGSALMYVVGGENLLSLCHVMPTVLNIVFTTAQANYL